MLIKIDLLSVECLDKIHTELDLLIEYGKIEPEATLKETYEKYLGIYNIERTDINMWKMVWNHEIPSLFQMEQQSGIQGIEILKPTSVDDLAILNSTIRLMTQEGATEAPTEKLARFKKDPKAWDKELAEWGLGDEEKKILEPIVGISYGLMIAQEQIMSVVQLPELGGFSLTWGDRLRKSIAKKNPADFEKLEEEFYKVNKEKNIKENFTKYVWQVLISMSKGYGFNQSHTLAYSLVALQEMNLAYKFPIIYWNTACLITDTGGSEDNEGDKTTNYTKLAQGINKMRNAGIEVALPDINTSTYSFKPDEITNHIIYGFRGLIGVGDEIINDIMSKRPFASFKDFLERTSYNKTVMISLIKSGCFDNFGERKDIMYEYIMSVSDTKSRLTLQNLNGLMSCSLLPKRVQAYKFYEFNRYLKANGTKELNNKAINFLTKYNLENLIQADLTLDMVAWKRVYDKEMDYYRDYIKNNQAKLLTQFNQIKFQEVWDKYATGNYSSWEMDSVCFYYHEHELLNINKQKYGIVDFYSLPLNPIVDKSYNFNGKEVTTFKLHKICGTCIAKNKAKSTVSLLTPDGVVDVKFNKEYFSIYDKTIKLTNAEGKDYVAEESWFQKGSKIMVTGIRSNNQFIVKKYKSTPGHRLYKITQITENGDVELQGERINEA